MECKACGTCCNVIGFNAETEVDEDTEKWYNLHGGKVFRKGDSVQIVLPVPCKALDQATMKCRIYEDRPDVCRRYYCWIDDKEE